jgi:hypothetical protein
MPGQNDRNRDADGRFTGGSRGAQRWHDDDDNGRENFGRGQQAPRDDRGRFMSEGENHDYYGRGRQYGEYGGGSGFGRADYDRGDYGRGDYERGSYGRNEYGRDEYGRDDDRNFRGMRGGGRGDWGYEETDYRGSRGGGNDSQGGRDRDEYGRFTSDDDGGRYPRGGRGGYDYDDDRGSQGGRGQGSRSRYEDHEGRGWFGDPRGHADAARLGWRHRR